MKTQATPIQSFLKLMLVCVGLSLLTSPAYAVLRDFDENNDPSRLFSSYESHVDSLPTSGEVQSALWSDTYWPGREGGAAWRWQMAGSGQPTNPFSYTLYEAWQIGQLSEAQMNMLSPAEKYDIATGRFDYPTVQRERVRTNPSNPKWYGLCHAVAAAATRYYEPKNTTVQVALPDHSTRNLTFYASDIKALLALASDRAAYTASSLGTRCDSTTASSDGSCWDTNPGGFYLAITNMVGLLKTSIILDVDPLKEVWNAAVKSYSAKLQELPTISANAAQGTVREIRVDMTVQHTIGAKPARNQTGGFFKSVLYSFTIEVDRSNNIIGGEWISTNRPDMLWFTNESMQLDPNLAFLSQLTEPLH